MLLRRGQPAGGVAFRGRDSAPVLRSLARGAPGSKGGGQMCEGSFPSAEVRRGSEGGRVTLNLDA